MNVRVVVMVLSAGLFASGCSGSDIAAPRDTDPTTTTSSAAVSSTTSSTEAPPTTLSDYEIELAAIAEAKVDISKVVLGFFGDPYDTSKGEEGMGLEYLTGALLTRISELPAQYEAEGEYARSDGDLIEIDDIRVDLETGKADVDICAGGTDEIVDLETGEVINTGDGLLSTADVFVELVDGEWLISEFFYSRAVGEREPCKFSE